MVKKEEKNLSQWYFHELMAIIKIKSLGKRRDVTFTDDGMTSSGDNYIHVSLCSRYCLGGAGGKG